MTPDLDRLQNLGRTEQGAAIVDAIWFTPLPANGVVMIGMVLICNQEGGWNAYIGVVDSATREKADANLVAECGAKVGFEIAAAAFPNRFTKFTYDS